MVANNRPGQAAENDGVSIWPREHFTFFRSYYDAIQVLSKKDRADIILAVCGYGLYGTEPGQMSAPATAVFRLIRPVIDSGIKKAESGAKGGRAKGKQDDSKPKANRKQGQSRQQENGNDNEMEVDKETENDNEVDVDAETEAPFDSVTTEDRKLKLMRGELGRGVIVLNDAQIAGLLDKMGIDMFDYYVDKLSDFITKKGAKVKNHYETILRWWREDSETKQ